MALIYKIKENYEKVVARGYIVDNFWKPFWKLIPVVHVQCD